MGKVYLDSQDDLPKPETRVVIACFKLTELPQYYTKRGHGRERFLIPGLLPVEGYENHYRQIGVVDQNKQESFTIKKYMAADFFENAERKLMHYMIFVESILVTLD